MREVSMLNEWITDLLQSRGEALRIEELAEYLNTRSDLRRQRTEGISAPELRSYIEDFPSRYRILNGWVTLADEKKWQDFMSVFSYLTSVLSGIYRTQDVQFIFAGLMLYARAVELRDVSRIPIRISEDAAYLASLSFAQPSEMRLFLRSLSDVDRDNNFTIPIFSELSRLLRRLPSGALADIALILQRIDVQAFNTSDFLIAFGYVLDTRNFESRRRPNLIRTPDPVVELMIALLSPGRGIVLDPMCGTGSLLTRIAQLHNNSTKLVGFEIDEHAARFAYMSLLLCTHKLPSIEVRSCFEELSSNSKFDYIVSDLPLTPVSNAHELLHLTEHYGISFPLSNKGFAATVLYIYTKLSLRGRAVFTVSEGFLSSSGGIDERVRQILIQDDVIEAVISLPPNSLRPYTNGKASILVLNKSKPSYLLGRIKFIDAAEPKYNNKTGGFDFSEILRSYKNKEIDEKSGQLVEVNSVVSANTLQVAFYTEKFHQIGELLFDRGAMPLGQLVEIKRGVNLLDKEDANHQEGIPFVRIENLERDILDMALSAEGLRSFIQSPAVYEKSIIDTEVILIARIGDYLKPTYFKPTKAIPRIVTHPNVLVLSAHPGGPTFNFDYLYYQLYSAFVQKQIERKRQGAVMPFISIKALKGLVIPFMGENAQAEFVATQKANIIATEREKVNQRLKLIGFEERDIRKESDVVSTLVHELRPKLVAIHSLANKLSRIIKTHQILNLTEFDSLDQDSFDPDLVDVVQPLENLNISEVSERLITDTEELNETLSVVQKVMNFSLKQEDFALVDVFGLIRDYFVRKAAEIGGAFGYDVKGTHVIANINPRSFEQVLDQLLANAVRHAFQSTGSSNHIIFNIREDKDRQLAIIEYSNNGTPFRLTEQDFIGFFHKSKGSVGSGIGGNFIYRVVKAHGGDLRVREGVKRGFYITIELPLKGVGV
jgi:signal transduction histidine kinase/SAM-dependent methyltransferase